MTEVIIKSYRKEREKEITDNLWKSMLKVKGLVQRQAVENLDNPRGGSEHPQRQSGRLIANVNAFSHIEKDADSITAVIGTNVYYGKYLEFGTIKMPPYPWLFPAVEMKKPEIIQILKEREFSIT